MRKLPAILVVGFLGLSAHGQSVNGSSTVTAGAGGSFTVVPSNDFYANAPTFLGDYELRIRKYIAAQVGIENAYTWGHSLDNGSQGFAVFWSQPAYNRGLDRGSSDFNVRHTATASFSHRLSPDLLPRLAGPFLGNWNLSSTIQARTGFPIDISDVDRSPGLGFDNNSRPDLVPGIPNWIPNALAPGGRQLNPAAFVPAGQNEQGTLGRNVLTGRDFSRSMPACIASSAWCAPLLLR